jgi:hypothetical protein
MLSTKLVNKAIDLGAFQTAGGRASSRSKSLFGPRAIKLSQPAKRVNQNSGAMRKASAPFARLRMAGYGAVGGIQLGLR